jgi:predicted glycoside hydrolase/deacetylase ChbG (UPF0249 family)
MDASRFLVVTADDYGIGPETSRGVLDLAACGVVSSAVLLVNAPHAADAVRAWRRSGVPLELGWHPNLTLDRPAAGAAAVPSLVGPDGRFFPLGAFVRRLLLGLARPRDLERELAAQYRLFLDLVGRPPTLVNTHQHVAVFPPVGDLLLAVLRRQRARPYFRRVREPWATLRRVPGARPKRLLLNALGRPFARRLERAGYPGNDWLVGVADPDGADDPDFFARWLRWAPGRVVELMCHPGHRDSTLVGRDCAAPDDGLMRRRPAELALLARPDFLDACRRAGFRLVAPSALAPRGIAHAA